MEKILVVLACLAIGVAHAQEAKRIEPVDAAGRPQPNRPGYTVGKDGAVTPVDAYGHRLTKEQHYVVKGNKIVPVDAYGRSQANKPSFEVKKDGRIIQKDPLGRTQSSKQFVMKEGRIYEADAYGRPKMNRPGYVVKPKE